MKSFSVYLGVNVVGKNKFSSVIFLLIAHDNLVWFLLMLVVLPQYAIVVVWLKALNLRDHGEENC